MANLIGQSLGRYHILEQLGEGGMATVYKAYDTRLERDVAVKVIRVDQFSPAALVRVLQRFEREAKSLAKLSHPNIVGVIDYGEHEGVPFLVMEYLPGGTLKQRLGKPIRWQEAARMLLPIASGLAYAHQRGVLHRDVKPSNILIGDSGEPMLTDFGIAKILEGGDAQTLTGTGIGVGTPEYMAPEQWTGGAGPQADIYSLGVVFYEIVTGRKPYVADTPAAVLLKQATEPLPRPGQYVPGLPEAVEKVLLKALARKPEDRYADMTAFVGALESLPAGAGKARPANGKAAGPRKMPAPKTQVTIAQEETYATRLQEATRDEFPPAPPTFPPIRPVIPTGAAKPKKAPWWPWVVGSGGLALLILVIYLAVLLITHLFAPMPTATSASTLAPMPSTTQAPATQPPATEAPTVAPTEAPAHPVQLVQESSTRVSSSRITSVTFSQDGTLLAAGSDDAGVYMWKVGETSARLIGKHNDVVISVAFSPDGSILASGSGDKTIQLWRVSNGTLIRTLTGHTATVESIAFSPNGTLCASSANNPDNTIRIWDTSDWSLLYVLSGHSGPVWDVAFSPDGQTLISSSQDNSIRLWNTSTGSLLRTLQGHGDEAFGGTFTLDGKSIVSASNDKTARVWDVSTGRTILLLNASLSLGRLVLSQSGEKLIVVGGAWEDPTIWVWQIPGGNLLAKHSIGIDMEVIRDIAISPSDLIAVALHDGTVRTYKLQE